MTLFESLYLEKKGVEYLKQTQDHQRIAWMIYEYGKDMVRDRMRTYFESKYIHSVVDYKTNIQKLSNPEAQDRSAYWEIIKEYEKNARRDN
jgi:hypothetical protein